MLLILLLLTSSDAEHRTLCASDACFTLHLEAALFETAGENCQNNGGNLMTIRSGEEEDSLRTLLSQTSQRTPFKLHIGLKLRRESCVISHAPLKGFKWLSGKEDSQYSNWEKDPQSTCHERCVSVHFNPTGQNHLKWRDGSCSRKQLPYVCEFYFKGMCKALVILGRGQILYTAPFSKDAKDYRMKWLPVGTFADITCDDRNPSLAVCAKTHGNVYAWSNPGPFCPTNRSCAVQNGGCGHVCNQEGEEVICSCNDGYELDGDGLSCGLRNMCFEDTCQHQCIMGETGFTCLCPPGLALDSDRRACSDIDECASHEVCGGHLCINMEGSYVCDCKDGYGTIDGECRDIDECVGSVCEHNCLNSVGSFSCHCEDGFELSEDGRSCKDIDECLVGRCKFECVNTRGSFLCACPNGFQLDRSGECFPLDDPSESLAGTPSEPPSESPSESTSESPSEPPSESTSEPPSESPSEPPSEPPSESSAVVDEQESFTESLSSTVELQHESPRTDAPPPDVSGAHVHGQGETSLASNPSRSANNRVMVCVLGSVVPLLLLVAITVGILVARCNQVKKEAKKNVTTDGYCWVSSGLDPRLEKLYESIPTDDL